jgi:HEAT repeat protein
MRLRDANEPTAIRYQLSRALTSPRPGNRAFASLAMRRLSALDPEPELLRRTLVDPSPDVRRAAALALRDSGDDAYLTACLQALDHRASVVRKHAAEALGTMHQSEAVEPLMHHLARIGQGSGSASGSSGPRGSVFVGTQRAYVQGFETNVANNAAIANPVIGTLQEGATLDVRVLGTSGIVATRAESQAVRLALGQITGEDPGRTVKAWERWWDRNGASWRRVIQADPVAAEAASPRERW